MPLVNGGLPDTKGMVTHEKGPNPRIPVYYKDELVWGLPPKAGPIVTVRIPFLITVHRITISNGTHTGPYHRTDAAGSPVGLPQVLEIQQLDLIAG
jgi:hypothetical protein